ncbi:hypothetical protein ACFS07_36605 [Undibacterium arcticum]
MTWFEKNGGGAKRMSQYPSGTSTLLSLHTGPLSLSDHLQKVIRTDKKLPWFQRPVGVVSLAIVESVIAAGIAKRLGWI